MYLVIFDRQRLTFTIFFILTSIKYNYPIIWQQASTHLSYRELPLTMFKLELFIIVFFSLQDFKNITFSKQNSAQFVYTINMIYRNSKQVYTDDTFQCFLHIHGIP